MKYTAIIIDDEPKLREVLTIKINKNCQNVEVIGKAKNAKEGYELITQLKPNIVFLDISMPSETGFEMLSRFEDIDFEIIFVTGYNEYGLDALKVSAVDYLLKPVKTEDLIKAIEKAVIRINLKEKSIKYENLVFNSQNLGNQKSKLAIPGTNQYQFIQIEDIIRFEGWQKYTKIHLANGECIVSSYNLGTYSDLIVKYDFYTVHKSHLINTNHIRRYLKEGIIVMSNDDQVPVARRRREEFINEFIKTIK